MRIEHSVTSISWIPSEAVAGLAKLPFGSGIAHYDNAPPGAITAVGADSVEELRRADRFRFANELCAFIDVEDGRIVGAGYTGSGSIGSTTIAFGIGSVAVAAVALADRQAEPEYGDGFVRFTQSAGGRTGVPAPRTVRRPPFVQYHAPIAWTTLEVVLYADGRAAAQLVGASSFPRHWVYGNDGTLTAKSGLVDFTTWYKTAFGAHTPWGNLDSPALVTAVETALERELSSHIMRGGHKPKIRKLREGDTLVAQGDSSDELFLVLDGVVSIEHNGVELVQVGPGAVLGERAILEGGHRTSTIRAVTNCKVAIVPAEQVDHEALQSLATGHRREADRRR